MAYERLSDRLAGRGVPDARRLVPGRGDNAVAVGAECDALYGCYVIGLQAARRSACRFSRPKCAPSYRWRR